jgi:hypothetical protein
MNKIFRFANLFVVTLITFSSYSQVQTIGTFTNEDDALDGYTLLFPLGSKNIHLINNCGQQINDWQTSTSTLVAYLLPNGDVLKTGMDSTSPFSMGGQQGFLERYSWDGNLVWSYKLSDNQMVLHHDIEMLPNGNILVMAWRDLGAAEKRATGRDSLAYDFNFPLWEEVIYEINPSVTQGATIVWEWHSSDHLVQDIYPSLPNYGDVSIQKGKFNINYALEGAGNPADWLHFNSIDYNAGLDQIMISSLVFNEVFIIDHSTTSAQSSGQVGGNGGKGGDILYRWGNIDAYDKGTLSDKKSFGQHDAQWINYGPYAGNMLIFNNGNTRGYSSIDIINLPWDGLKYQMNASGTFGPDSAVYSYSKSPKTDLFSTFISGAEVLKNGNIIITEGAKGKITELRPDSNKIVWEYINPITTTGILKQGEASGDNLCFRSYKYPTDYSAFNTRIISTGLPLELEPWPSDCNGIDTTRRDTLDDNDTTAFVYYPQVSNLQPTVFPNPSSGKIRFKSLALITSITISEPNGKVLYEEEVLNADLIVDLSLHKSGLYFIQYKGKDFTNTAKLLLVRE